jgi:hypothetical protein
MVSLSWLGVTTKALHGTIPGGLARQAWRLLSDRSQVQRLAGDCDVIGIRSRDEASGNRFIVGHGAWVPEGEEEGGEDDH